MKRSRMLRHLFATRWRARQCFTPAVLDQIEAAIHEVEARHSGEIRFVVEPSLDTADLWANLSPRERALEVFAHLGVWDTEKNNGVLIYVLFADHDVEILADRGIASVVPQQEWERICREIEAHYREGRFAQGSVEGIRSVGRLLEKHFPSRPPDANELPDRPVIL
ncbi:MAG: TPM domain-containing protein [Steroidobacteraceae bacterium]|nr:TPM domain-containing protein [Steroidobacteraceae bacterium]